MAIRSHDISYELTKQIDKIDKQISNFNPQEHKDKTRATIAKNFVIAYMFMLAGVLLLVPLYNMYVVNSLNSNELLLSVQDIFPMVASAIGGPLGFVVGYYFKSEEHT